MHKKYVHGYSHRESVRLSDQANTLSELLHADTIFPEGSMVLEVGCGVGAQTEIICKRNPHIQLTSIDISESSLQIAQEKCKKAGISNVNFLQADLYDMPFHSESFDYAFLCFVLEHVTDPETALQKIKYVIKLGGVLTAIEGDHGSAYYHPRSNFAQKTINCLIKLQAQTGADSLIGRRLYPLLKSQGFSKVLVSPRMVYADANKPEMVDGFTVKTFIAMVEGVEEKAIQEGLIDKDTWNVGMHDLYKTALPDGVFCYTFFKAHGTKE
jgi:ubiquinone/menaquinone biosynthesis C-methylase UbiE